MRYTKENEYQVKGLARESSMDGILDVSCYETLRKSPPEVCDFRWAFVVDSILWYFI